MAHFGPTRRSLLQGTLAASALSLTGFPARAEPQWEKYAGTTIEANLIKGPRGELLQKYASEFTDLTGIKVESEVIPEQQQRQKAVIELTSGKPSFDVVHVSYHVQKRQFEKAGWLADLTPFMKDPNLTAPDLTVNDFSAGGLKFAQNDKGEMHSLPWSVDYFILYWNKELFAKKGVTLPKTFDEMAVAAEKLNDPANGIYGFTGRGLRNANMTLWTNFFLNYGGEFLDAKGNILTDGPEAIEATKMYQRLLTKVAPPGVSGFNWMESMASFTQGRAAMWIDGVGWAPPLEDPAASRIVGKVGYTMVPAGPKGQYSATYGDGLGIAQASKNKEAAYLLCQWAVSKAQGSRLLQAGGGVPFRNSILNDAEVRKGVKLPQECLPALIVVLAVIIFPWAYTVWMSLHEWKVGAPPTFVGLANYIRLPSDARFVESVWHTLVYTALSVALPLLLGTLAAVVFHAKFPMRGFLRGLFILPMMATPVAIALVWTMMFHPQLGILNYLLSLVGLPPQLWVFHPATVIPSLVLVETWQWTPLVMLIVLGGLAAIPSEPYESALIDGATRWQTFRYISLPLIMPFLFIASMIRMIDAVKSFDIIFAITQGGPGSASETINLYLYSVAFVYYDVGYASAIVVVFFALIVALAAALLRLRQKTHWNDAGGVA